MKKKSTVKRVIVVICAFFLMFGAIGSSISANSPNVDTNQLASEALHTEDVQPEYIPFLAGAIGGWYAYNRMQGGTQTETNLYNYTTEDLEVIFD